MKVYLKAEDRLTCLNVTQNQYRLIQYLFEDNWIDSFECEMFLETPIEDCIDFTGEDADAVDNRQEEPIVVPQENPKATAVFKAIMEECNENLICDNCKFSEIDEDGEAHCLFREIPIGWDAEDMANKVEQE